MNIYVGNLSHNVSEEDLKQSFGTFWADRISIYCQGQIQRRITRLWIRKKCRLKMKHNWPSTA